MARASRICSQCHVEYNSGWRNDGSLLMLVGVGLVVWHSIRSGWFDIIFNGLLFALPCFVFGFEQRKNTRLCPKCFASRNDAQ